MNFTSRISGLVNPIVLGLMLGACSDAGQMTAIDVETGEAETAQLTQQSVLEGPAVIVLQPDAAAGKDTLINDFNPDANQGEHVALTAGAWTISGAGMVQRGLLSFDLSQIPAGTKVTSASLSLWADTVTPVYGQGIHNGLPLGHSDLSGSNEVLIRRVTSPWDEQTVTWNSQPSTTEQNQVLLAASTSPSQDYLDQDVTALVQDMINDPSASDGFMLQLQTEQYHRELTFVSSDSTSSELHPRLVIELDTGANNAKTAACHADFVVHAVNGTKVTLQSGSFATNGVAGEWSFGNGDTQAFSTTDQFVYDFLVPGQYDVCLTVNGYNVGSGTTCEDKECKTLQIVGDSSCPFGTRRECRQECREEKRECKDECKDLKASCMADCDKLSGKAKRKCKRACRKEKRECKHICRDVKSGCRESCTNVCN